MRPKYPHRVTVAMTDNMFRNVKQALNLRHMMEDLAGDNECDILLLHICKAIDENESNPIFLRSIKESMEKKESKK